MKDYKIVAGNDVHVAHVRVLPSGTAVMSRNAFVAGGEFFSRIDNEDDILAWASDVYGIMQDQLRLLPWE